HPVTVNMQNRSLEEVLSEVLKGVELGYKVVDKNMIITKVEKAGPARGSPDVLQERKLVRNVTVQHEKPLEGVTVAVKGTYVVTTSDGRGDYQIALPQNAATLVFSIVGFTTQEATILTGNVLNISLRTQVSILDEVVMVGYGTQRRRDLTGAISS